MQIVKPPFDYARLEREMEAFMPCRHYNAIIALKLTVSGRPFYRLQCSDCGAPVSKRLRKDEREDLLEKGVKEGQWNEEAAREYSIKWSRFSWPISERINFERRMAWWANYTAYLNSDEWKMRSIAALRAAKYLCQVCGRGRACHVHHLSYERAGCEAPEDLQALCFKCHDAAHNGLLSMQKAMDEIDREFGVEAMPLPPWVYQQD